MSELINNDMEKYANWKAPDSGGRSPEYESSVDFTQIERSLADGTAGEYIENVGALPVEGLLEEQGDERVWPQLSIEEQTGMKEKFSPYSLRLVEDEVSCMAMVA